MKTQEIPVDLEEIDLDEQQQTNQIPAGIKKTLANLLLSLSKKILVSY
jgi:hypothetical protein